MQARSRTVTLGCPTVCTVIVQYQLLADLYYLADWILGDAFLRNVYSLYDYGSLTNANDSAPFIQVLSVSITSNILLTRSFLKCLVLANRQGASMGQLRRCAAGTRISLPSSHRFTDVSTSHWLCRYVDSRDRDTIRGRILHSFRSRW